MKITLELNGTRRAIEVESAAVPLLDALRAVGLFSVKRGCETGDCGVCAVLIDGLPRASCIIPAPQAAGRSVITVEAMGRRGQLHPLQEAFLEHGAIQCGFCSPAMLLTAKALLDRSPRPSESETREALSGVLCRCTGYLKPLQAIKAAARRLAAGRRRGRPRKET